MAALEHETCNGSKPKTKDSYRIHRHKLAVVEPRPDSQSLATRQQPSAAQAKTIMKHQNKTSSSNLNERRRNRGGRFRFLSRTFSASDLIRGEALRRTNPPGETETPGDSSDEEIDDQDETCPPAQRKKAQETTVPSSAQRKKAHSIASSSSSSNNNSQNSNNHHHHHNHGGSTRTQLFFRANSGDHASVSSRSTTSSATPKRSNRYVHAKRRRNTDSSIESLVSDLQRRGSITSSSAGASSASSPYPVLMAPATSIGAPFPKRPPKPLQSTTTKSVGDSPRSTRSVRFEEQMTNETVPSPIILKEATVTDASGETTTKVKTTQQTIIKPQDDGSGGDIDANEDDIALVCEEPRDEESVIKSYMDCSSISFRSMYGERAAIPSVVSSAVTSESLSTLELSSSPYRQQTRLVQPTFVAAPLHPEISMPLYNNNANANNNGLSAPTAMTGMLSSSPPIMFTSPPFAIVGQAPAYSDQQNEAVAQPRYYCYRPPSPQYVVNNTATTSAASNAPIAPSGVFNGAPNLSPVMHARTIRNPNSISFEPWEFDD